MIFPYHCKAFLSVLGIAIAIQAFVSHWESAWFKEEIYKICDAGFYISPGVSINFQNCPSINMEKFFVGAALSTIILSFILGFFTKGKSDNGSKNIDIGYHALAAVAMISGSICFLLSTEQIDRLSIMGVSFNHPEARKELLRTQKLVAGSLGILQGLVYGLTALALRKTMTAGQPEQAPNTNFAHMPPNNNLAHILPNTNIAQTLPSMQAQDSSKDGQV